MPHRLAVERNPLTTRFFGQSAGISALPNASQVGVDSLRINMQLRWRRYRTVQRPRWLTALIEIPQVCLPKFPT
jgi:hypothetical protein